MEGSGHCHWRLCFHEDKAGLFSAYKISFLKTWTTARTFKNHLHLKTISHVWVEAEDEERQWAARCGSSLGSSFYHFIAGDPEPRLVLSSVSPSSRGVSNLALSEDTPRRWGAQYTYTLERREGAMPAMRDQVLNANNLKTIFLKW